MRIQILYVIKYAAFMLLPLLSGCDAILLGEDDSAVTLHENLKPPTRLNDGWSVSSLDEEGVNRNEVEFAIKLIQQNPRRIHSLLIIKNGKLISESYYDGWHRDRLQSLRSASKSFASTLVGIAIDNQFIKDTDEPLFNFFPEHADLKNDSNKEIKLKHVLAMTSGFKWDQSTYAWGDSRNDEYGIDISDNAIRYVLGKEIISMPGESFLYNSGNSDLLPAIVGKASNLEPEQFANKYLFAPLNITDYIWNKHNSGGLNAGWGLFLKPRDMAKLGQLVLDNGQWNGQRIVSANWIKMATDSAVSANEKQQYGYQWWLTERTVGKRKIKTVQAQGNGGQVIFIVPELNAVVVFTGGNYDSSDSELPYNLFDGYILRALL